MLELMLTRYCPLDSEKKSLQNRLEDLKETKQRLLSYDNEYDKLILEKAKAVLQHKEHLCIMRDANQAVTEAAIRLIEASSDVAALKEHNSGIVKSLEDEKQRVEALVVEADVAKTQAKAAQVAFISVISTGAGAEVNTERRDYLIGMSEGKTVDRMEADIEAENAKLELISAADPGVLQEFEKRARDIERSQREKTRKEQQLDELNLGIQVLREAWEPRLDEIVRQINDAFSYNFEQISCAGEVGVHKDEDFDKWAIEIKVKFRYVARHLPGALRFSADTATERTRPSRSSTSTVNPAASAPYPPSSTSCPSSRWRSRPSVSLTRSTRVWIRATSAWSTNAWSRSLATSTRLNTSSSRPNCSQV